MHKWIVFLFLISTAHAITLTDDRQVSLNITVAPQRIVTLLPSLAETVCVLGVCDRLVGTDRYANWPESVKVLPKLGGLDDLQIESLVRLKPDLVLAPRSSRSIARLTQLGIPVLALEPQNQADVQRVIRIVAQALILPNAEQKANELWQTFVQAQASAKQRVPLAMQGKSVYFEASTAGYAATEDSFIGELLKSLTLNNIVPSSLGSFPQVNPEFVVRANPQIIMIGETSVKDFTQRPGWSRIQAIQKKHVCTFTREQGDVLVRPGPRMMDAIDVLLNCLNQINQP